MKYHLKIAVNTPMPPTCEYLASSDSSLDEYTIADDLNKMYAKAIQEWERKRFSGEAYMDSGFDLFTPFGFDVKSLLTSDRVSTHNDRRTFTFDFNVRCSVAMFDDHGNKYPSGFYLYPRSSLSKTPFRLANSVGIIDSGYRGTIMAKVDYMGYTENPDREDTFEMYIFESYKVDRGSRYFQLCNPMLMPWDKIELVSVDDLDDTSRGTGGFGSTGV